MSAIRFTRLSKRAVGTSAIAVCVLSAIMLSSASASPSTAVPATTAASASVPTATGLTAAVEAAQRAQILFGTASHFAGVVIQPDQQHFTIFSTNAPATAGALEGAQIPADLYDIVPAKWSQAILERATRALDSEFGKPDSLFRSLNPSDWGPDFRNNSVRVGIADPSRVGNDQLASLERATGGVSISVTYSPLAPTRFASRASDSSPWNAGDFTRYYDGSALYSCTSGFAGTAGGYTYYLTAGHCYGESAHTRTARIYSTDQGHPIGGPGPYPLLGVADSELVDQGYDLGTIRAQNAGSFSSGLAWRTLGPTDTNAKANVKGATPSTVGQTGMCASGAFSGERCGTTVTATGASVNLGGIVTKPLNGIAMTDPNAAGVAGQGDSGGPVYMTVSNGVLGSGVIIGPASDQRTCPNPSVSSGRICTRGVWYHDLQNVLNYRGLTLVTS